MPISIKITLGIVYAVGMVIAYIIFRIWSEFDNNMVELAFAVLFLWPLALCAVIICLIGKLIWKGLDRAAYAVRDAIWRVQEKRGKGS